MEELESVFENTETETRTTEIKMLTYVDIFGKLYHGTDINSGFSILRNGIKLPTSSRWTTMNGHPVPLEHGIRFYTTSSIEAARQFAPNGMIIKFEAPFPMGRIGEINPGPGSGEIQVSFKRDNLKELWKRITYYSANGGLAWIPHNVEG